jgi:hypothetical protein
MNRNAKLFAFLRRNKIRYPTNATRLLIDACQNNKISHNGGIPLVSLFFREKEAEGAPEKPI